MSLPRSIRSSRWLALPMMALVLGLSAAPVLSRMTCLMGGHQVLAIGNMEDCCPEDEPSDLPSLRATCCDFAQAVPAKEDYRPEPTLALAVGSGPASMAILESITLVGSIAAEQFSSRPPPLSAPSRLSRISLFLL